MAIRLPHTSDYYTYDVSPDGQRLLVMQRALTNQTTTGPVGPELPTPGLMVAMHLSALQKK